MKKYLVTGGCGFIGSHLADALIKAGHHVRILDDLSSGKRSQAPQEAELIIGTITDRSRVRQALRDVDGCFHLAAIASVQRSVEEWSSTHLVNVYGTLLLLEEIARQRRPIPFFFASSAAAYEKSSPYGADKGACEEQIALAWRLFQIPSLIFRFFNVYGPRQDPTSPYSGVISIFLSKLQNDQDVTIYGDGEQTRDFIFVDDLIEFLVEAAKIPLEGSKTFDLCTGKATSINALAQIIGNVLNSDLNIQHDSPRDGEVRHSTGNPEAAWAYFRRRATTELADGISQMIEKQKVK